MLSLSYLTVDGAEPLEHVEAAAAGGFDGADVRLLAAAPDAPLSIEVPDIRMADSGPGERAARAMQWTRAFFASGQAPE